MDRQNLDQKLMESKKDIENLVNSGNMDQVAAHKMANDLQVMYLLACLAIATKPMSMTPAEEVEEAHRRG